MRVRRLLCGLTVTGVMAGLLSACLPPEGQAKTSLYAGYASNPIAGQPPTNVSTTFRVPSLHCNSAHDFSSVAIYAGLLNGAMSPSLYRVGMYGLCDGTWTAFCQNTGEHAPTEALFNLKAGDYVRIGVAAHAPYSASSPYRWQYDVAVSVDPPSPPADQNGDSCTYYSNVAPSRAQLMVEGSPIRSNQPTLANFGSVTFTEAQVFSEASLRSYTPLLLGQKTPQANEWTTNTRYDMNVPYLRAGVSSSDGRGSFTVRWYRP